MGVTNHLLSGMILQAWTWTTTQPGGYFLGTQNKLSNRIAFDVIALFQLQPAVIPSGELTYPLLKVAGKMIFLFPRWDMLVPCMEGIYIYIA